MKKLIAKLMVVLMLTGMFTVVGSAANAAPAQAASMLNCRLLDAGYGYEIWTNFAHGRYATSCYQDYTWAEEVAFWWFAHDGWVVVNARDWRCDWQYRVGC